jgi:hypothetical protein
MPVTGDHCGWIKFQVGINYMERYVLGRILRQQREHSDSEGDDVLDVEELTDIVLLDVVDDILQDRPVRWTKDLFEGDAYPNP